MQITVAKSVLLGTAGLQAPALCCTADMSA